jgi:S-adenosylmethionine hydrolase
MIITLTTDFGLSGPFAGIMKGVILQANPDCQIIDLSHNVATHDIAEASRVLQASFPYFPAGTVHVVVVDPGVGSNRHIICLQHKNQYLLAPDNGVLTPFFADIDAAFTVKNTALFLDNPSSTFQGRDIFAPVAGLISLDLPLELLGAKIDVKELVQLEFPTPSISEDNIVGECISIDRFGNVATNITRENLLAFCPNLSRLSIFIHDLTIHGLSSHYAEGNGTIPIALINSQDYLELSLFKKNCAEKLQLSIGHHIKILKNRHT